MSDHGNRAPSQATHVTKEVCEEDSGYLSGPLLPSQPCGKSTEQSSSLVQSFALTVEPPREPVVSGDLPWQTLFAHDDEDGNTKLHIAAYMGCEESVDIIIAACPQCDLLNIQNDYGETPLHTAVVEGHHVIVRKLVQAGASIECRDFEGDTPIHKAVIYGHKDCLKALLEPLPGKSHVTSAVLNEKNYEGKTSVHCAVLKGYIELLQLLVSYGADVNAREGLGGDTVLHEAAQEGDVALVRCLLEQCGASISVLNYRYVTPRYLAFRSRNRAADLFAAIPLAEDEEYIPSDFEEADEDEDEYEEDEERARECFQRLVISREPQQNSCGLMIP